MKKAILSTSDKILGLDAGLLKLFILPILLIFIFIISLGTVIFPRIKVIDETLKEIKTVKQETLLMEEKRNYLLSVDTEELNKNAFYLDSAVLKEELSFLLIGVVRRVTDKYGFQIRSFSTAPGELKIEDKIKISDVNVMKKIPISLDIAGPKENYLDLITALERSLPILFIDSFELSLSGDIATLDLSISSYYLHKNDAVNVNNLSLADLTLKKEESDVVSLISQFELIESEEKTEETKEFVKYDRPKPFDL